MATVACELNAAFDRFHWTGFYRTVRSGHLKVGPYQGGHGCLDIPFGKGVCGASAAEKRTIVVDDVDAFPGHIACSSSTRSEIVVPVLDGSGRVVAVLDVDSDDPAAFDDVDRQELEAICSLLGERFGDEAAALID
ncbi:MAG: GAF domain-containing protein [Rhodothermales bacterium]|nr:GAF domain-containing protein [Rhodothermales bacterium]